MEDEEVFFWTQVYKVYPCPFKHKHDWQACCYSHGPSESAARRPPTTYVSVCCPCSKQGKPCPAGDSCPFAHSMFEYWLHPSRYRTVLCQQGSICTRSVCFFAHNAAELRKPADVPVANLLSGNQLQVLVRSRRSTAKRVSYSDIPRNGNADRCSLNNSNAGQLTPFRTPGGGSGGGISMMGGVGAASSAPGCNGWMLNGTPSPPVSYTGAQHDYSREQPHEHSGGINTTAAQHTQLARTHSSNAATSLPFGVGALDRYQVPSSMWCCDAPTLIYSSGMTLLPEAGGGGGGMYDESSSASFSSSYLSNSSLLSVDFYPPADVPSLAAAAAGLPAHSLLPSFEGAPAAIAAYRDFLAVLAGASS